MQGRDIILGILMRQPQTGYDITQMVKNKFSFFYAGSTGMVYPALRKLEKEGKVEKKLVEQSDKPNKKVYSITAAGKKEFMRYLASPVEPNVLISDFLARLEFSDYLTQEQLNQIIEQRIVDQKRDAEEFKEYANSIGKNEAQNLALQYALALREFNVRFFEQKLNERKVRKEE